MTDAPKKSPFDEQFMTVKELADMLGISATTVYNSLWKWPHLRTTAKGVVRFREAHVEEILELMTVRPKPPEPRHIIKIGTRAGQLSRLPRR
jgi:predicted DNA-binding transcriptional regulator AlpA